MPGADWKKFNADQKQVRKDMVPLYGTKRPLLQGRVGLGAGQHVFAPMFVLQVQARCQPYSRTSGMMRSVNKFLRTTALIWRKCCVDLLAYSH